MTKKSNPEAMKWPTDKDKYDRNYLRLFGKVCPKCKGTGEINFSWVIVPDAKICSKCLGLGYVEK